MFTFDRSASAGGSVPGKSRTEVTLVGGGIGAGAVEESLRSVVFDWRSTLVTSLLPHEWVGVALQRLGRDHDQDLVTEVWARIAAAAGDPDRLDAPGVDTDAARHREVYHGVFADAGLDADLAEALYTVESVELVGSFGPQ
ncbi:hypothetical protein [Polymorphospora lycopeni]|uniref:Uncharacterized protein n=1 Tax=Polymorphospora lycopeni TaxID=3140240 RepID=A0ABV5D1F5_9ACTN